MTSTNIQKEEKVQPETNELELQNQETLVDVENKVGEVIPNVEGNVEETNVEEGCSEILQEEKKENCKESTVTHRGHKHKHKHHHHEEHDHHHGDHEHSHIDADILNSSSKVRAAVGGFILWLSLVSHSVFDGLAIGILSDFVRILSFIFLETLEFICNYSLSSLYCCYCFRNSFKKRSFKYFCFCIFYHFLCFHYSSWYSYWNHCFHHSRTSI
jgi:hypothetical protein